MKKIIAIIFALILTLSVCSCTNVTDIAVDLDSYIKTLDYHDGFTILQLTDIHWNLGTQIGDGTYGSVEYLNKLILETEEHIGGKIDLIEITGDTFMLCNSQAVERFVEFMEGLDIPYAITWGNHDREGEYNPNWLSEKFINAKNSLYTEVDDTITGRSNYIINLVDENGETVYQIAHLDSGSSYRMGAGDVSLSYDYLRTEQLDWLKAEHELAGEDVPVVCYYHIAQAEVSEYCRQIEKGELECKCGFYKLEGFGESDYCEPVEQTLLDCNVKAVFMGHCHANDITFTAPCGITYGFGVKSGTELYYGVVENDAESFILTGASLVTLEGDGELAIEHLYLNENENGDFVKWEKY